MWSWSDVTAENYEWNSLPSALCSELTSWMLLNSYFCRRRCLEKFAAFIYSMVNCSIKVYHQVWLPVAQNIVCYFIHYNHNYYCLLNVYMFNSSPVPVFTWITTWNLIELHIFIDTISPLLGLHFPVCHPNSAPPETILQPCRVSCASPVSGRPSGLSVWLRIKAQHCSVQPLFFPLIWIGR